MCVVSVRCFIEERLGFKYIEGRSVEFAKSFEESGPSTPIFFILSPGVDPLKVERGRGRVTDGRPARMGGGEG